ncbi:DUF1203 domain-containing protein [Puniceibacterium sediminis]|uniref:DUF1203 domain-containing protein n=1 Tax=Puniceibacterium sediminis TaxID=1608407 RepID=A0A238VVM7_9RHOB|nr:DUF1203 domain-containing protein [Puniceibacterium sediminis]SNR38402.1 Protein of unknown function [Puniceibacterium sediminis]
MIQFAGMPSSDARAYQSGAADAYGRAPEHKVSDGLGSPCRHCLRHVPIGAAMLVLAYRPFGALQPYAETGPVFLCADRCEAYRAEDGMPTVLSTAPDYLIKGYSADERIVYGTGGVFPAAAIRSEVESRLRDNRLAFVDIRSARNNCWQARAARATPRSTG